MEEGQTLRSCYSDAELRRRRLEASWEPTSQQYQDNLTAAILAYETCLKIVDQVSLFSANETLEDVNSCDLQYLLINYHVAELILRVTGKERKSSLHASRSHFNSYLKLIDTYDILSRQDSKVYERYLENPAGFSATSASDAGARRQAKIARYKEGKELKSKLEILRQSPSILQNDETKLRELHLTHISLCIHQTFQSLESIAQELQVLALAPPTPQNRETQAPDERERNGRIDEYSERLDAPSSSLANQNGPILNQDGKLMRPFTLLDKRQQLHQGVFRPDHSLPTMTIDEYLEEEKRRGGIIEGGGPQSGLRPEPNEDDFDKADEETMKARAWDEFKEENPKGAGNTMNMG